MNYPYATVDVIFNGLEITVGIDFSDELNPCIDTMEATSNGDNLFGLITDLGRSLLLYQATEQLKQQALKEAA